MTQISESEWRGRFDPAKHSLPDQRDLGYQVLTSKREDGARLRQSSAAAIGRRSTLTGEEHALAVRAARSTGGIRR